MEGKEHLGDVAKVQGHQKKALDDSGAWGTEIKRWMSDIVEENSRWLFLRVFHR